MKTGDDIEVIGAVLSPSTSGALRAQDTSDGNGLYSIRVRRPRSFSWRTTCRRWWLERAWEWYGRHDRLHGSGDDFFKLSTLVE
jgi:hypothetical protein